METYNIYVNNVITGDYIIVIIGRTLEEIEELFKIKFPHSKSDIEEIVGVHLWQVEPNEWIGAGVYVRVLKRDNFLQDMNTLKEDIGIK